MLAVAGLQLKKLLGEAASLGLAVSMLSDEIGVDLASLLSQGVVVSSAAVGQYSWSDVGIIDPDVGTGISNRQCDEFKTTVSTAEGQADFHRLVASHMALVLAVPAGAIEFPVDIVCAAVDVQQTRADQAAAFQISSMTITAVYQLFAANAAYVDFSNADVNVALQGTEQTAPLALKPALESLRFALRLAFLERTRVFLGLLPHY
jgi:hypothetical protein